MYLTSRDIKEYRISNEPKECPIFKRPSKNWHVDHCHKSGMVRGVVSNWANFFIGKVENSLLTRCSAKQSDIPDILRRTADYLEQKNSGILHPVGLRQLTRRFSALTSSEQVAELINLGANVDLANELVNNGARAKQFRKLMKIKHQ